MESLYLLIPLSAALVLGLIGVFGWALNTGQFEALDREGRRILDDDEHPAATGAVPVDLNQGPAQGRPEQFQP
jgi:cbb3-type cytochrome oxidase maturation protein